MNTTQIFVALVDEGVEVWRAVNAVHVDGDVYSIGSQPYDREIERWHFEPGEQVVCEMIHSEKTPIFAATRRSTRRWLTFGSTVDQMRSTIGSSIRWARR